MQVQHSAGLLQRRRRVGLGLARPGFVQAARMDLGRPGLLGQRGDDLGRPATPQHQGGATRRQAVGKATQAMVQPPTLRASDPPFARRFVVEDVKRDDRPRPDRRCQRGLIGEA